MSVITTDVWTSVIKINTPEFGHLPELSYIQPLLGLQNLTANVKGIAFLGEICYFLICLAELPRDQCSDHFEFWAFNPVYILMPKCP